MVRCLIPVYCYHLINYLIFMLMMTKHMIDNRAFPPEIKRPGRETDNSPPSGAQVKNA
jgi:hypothetical protein